MRGVIDFARGFVCSFVYVHRVRAPVFDPTARPQLQPSPS